MHRSVCWSGPQGELIIPGPLAGFEGLLCGKKGGDDRSSPCHQFLDPPLVAEHLRDFTNNYQAVSAVLYAVIYHTTVSEWCWFLCVYSVWEKWVCSVARFWYTEATEATACLGNFLQFLRWQVDKIDLDRSFEILNAILLFSCRCFCSGAARGPPEIGFTRKFLAAPLS